MWRGGGVKKSFRVPGFPLLFYVTRMVTAPESREVVAAAAGNKTCTAASRFRDVIAFIGNNLPASYGCVGMNATDMLLWGFAAGPAGDVGSALLNAAGSPAPLTCG